MVRGATLICILASFPPPVCRGAGDTLDGYIADLRNGSDARRMAAARALGAMGADAARAAPALAMALEPRIDDTRAAIAIALRKIGAPAIRELCEAIGKTRGEERIRVVSALKIFGREASVAIDPLVGLLKSADAELKSAAAEALGSIVPLKDDKVAARVVVALIGLLNDPDSIVRFSAVHSLRFIPAETKKIVPAMIERLANDGDPMVRRNSALTLGRIGKEALSAVPLLQIASMSDLDETVRDCAAEALAKINKSVSSKP